MAPSWFSAVVGAMGLLLAADGPFASAQGLSRLAAGPSYRSTDTLCPAQCIVKGPDPSGWPAYHSMRQLGHCEQTIFYSFSLYDHVDDPNTHHRIFACTAYGKDWQDEYKAKLAAAHPATDVSVNYEIGWSSHDQGSEAEYISLIKQMREYVVNGHGPTNKTTMLYAQFGGAAAGLYIGQGLRAPDVASVALNALEYNTEQFDGYRESLAMQLCGPSSDSDHIVGFMTVSNGTFSTIQEAFKSWSNAECLAFDNSTNFTTTAPFRTPLLSSIKAKEAPVNATGVTQDRVVENMPKRWLGNRLAVRGECRTEKVNSGDSCAVLAERCGISGADFTKYNSAKGFCSSLMPGQHVCCSEGELPDFRPKPNADGSCATVKVEDGQSCSVIAAANSLETDDLEEFNKNTWGWNGCSNVWAGTIVCVSKGTPPMPAPVDNAICGPQVPGTKQPSDMSKLSELNPCPLNACCDVWGQCGTTPEFCTDTGTGAPGTAKPNTNGCISNCGTSIVKGPAPSEFRSIGYYEGYSFNRKCLYQDALQIDTSKYTHLHFGFGTISPDYEISIGDATMTYEFNNFRYIQGPKRILSFGGWDFSTLPETYHIFREGTAPANRLKLATNIANFIKENDLDGVDIDWEYPGAPDIRGIPPGDEDEGTNYLAFLVILKNLLPGKSVSIAAPASYWYLKGFPIAQISKVVDYIVFMTYDLHGQWDAGNPNSQPGCDSGSCLRSHVNLTETQYSLAMITKAGVPSGQVVVGVTSYGRSFAMAEPGCYGPQCHFTGSQSISNAKKGECTDTAGYLANAEIYNIINNNSSRVTKQYIDTGSNSNILVYDDIEWVAYMSPEIRDARIGMYKGMNMGGSVNWATDLEEYLDPPEGVPGWGFLKMAVKSGGNPVRRAGDRHGNWTELTCDDPYVVEIPDYTPQERWGAMDATDAWNDIVTDWRNYRDGPKPAAKLGFTSFVVYLIGGPPTADCGELESMSCTGAWACNMFYDDRKTGPAAAFIWNSLVGISTTYNQYHSALVSAAALLIDNSLDDLENKFAPVSPSNSDTWLDILLNLISMGTPMAGGKFFTSVVEKLPAMAVKSDATKAKAKEVTTTLLSGGVSIGSDLKKPQVKEWTNQQQDEFSHYLGQSLYVWDKITIQDLQDLFDGSDESLYRLTSLVSDGTFIAGVRDSPTASDDQNRTVEESTIRAFYGFAIPALWQASGHHPFIIDTGRDCNDKAKDDDKLKTACYENRLYKLADPDGRSHPCTYNCGLPGGCTCSDTPFSSLKGVDELDGNSWGGVTVQDLIIGSVKTYLKNGKENGAPPADPTDPSTFDSLVNDDITTPGYIRMPVCTETLARRSWANADKTESSRDKPNFPCNVDNGKDYCGDSTFVDQTSGASPPIEDCLQIVKNIQGTSRSWNSQLLRQRELLHYGECQFGVTGKGLHGNVNFDVGAQDVIDIIRDSIRKFGNEEGKVGAKGVMQCQGNIKDQEVEWGLY